MAVTALGASYLGYKIGKAFEDDMKIGEKILNTPTSGISNKIKIDELAKLRARTAGKNKDKIVNAIGNITKSALKSRGSALGMAKELVKQEFKDHSANKADTRQ